MTDAELWPQEVWLCQSAQCGLRFPARQNDPRSSQCPICDAPTEKIETFERPPAVQDKPRGTYSELTIVLDNIRSANNVGSILRTAEAVGASVAICGFTATPDNPKVAKTALGAHTSLMWGQHRNALVLVETLQQAGTIVWALESTPASVPLSTVPIRSEPLALVVGNEVSGVDPGILRIADAHVHLPMVGSKTSLNVAVAMGAASYILRTRQ